MWARGEFTTAAHEADDEPAPAQDTRAEALAVFGLVAAAELPPPGGDDGEWHLWPELVDVFNDWLAVQTQWRRGGHENRRTGLDYAGVLAYLHTRTRNPRRRAERFDLLQHMERAALAVWSEQ